MNLGEFSFDDRMCTNECTPDILASQYYRICSHVFNDYKTATCVQRCANGVFVILTRTAFSHETVDDISEKELTLFSVTMTIDLFTKDVTFILNYHEMMSFKYIGSIDFDDVELNYCCSELCEDEDSDDRLEDIDECELSLMYHIDEEIRSAKNMAAMSEQPVSHHKKLIIAISPGMYHRYELTSKLLQRLFME